MKKNNPVIIIFLILIPVIIYLFFFKVRANTIYGDDLYTFHYFLHAKNFSEIMHLFSTSFGKFRPVSTFFINLIFELFQKNMGDYYFFNIFVQTINTYLVALILNLFLKSPVISLLFSLIYGLTRFSFFVCSQPLSGGAIEGLGITFFLLSLFFILNILLKNDRSGMQVQKAFLWCILFANLSIYTHERYIVLLPFIVMVIIFFPIPIILTIKQKMLLSIISLSSILLNVIAKKYIYSLPFFVGTGGTNISFSFHSAISFFTDAVLCILQINKGNLSHTGERFSALSLFQQILVSLFALSLLTIIMLYLFNMIKNFTLLQRSQKKQFYIFLFLSFLFVFCLIPAVVTIRLEQRWLQAPFCIFIIILAIALNNLQFRNLRFKNTVFFIFIAIFVYINGNYFYKGTPNLYITNAQQTAALFKNAINEGIIHPGTSILYIWEKHVSIEADGYINWDIGGGYLFEFYQNKSKKIIFVDSIYHRSDTGLASSFPNFNKDSAQILYIRNGIADITDQYLIDSLKNFNY